MQVNANQVIVQLSAAPAVAGSSVPVFSVSRTPVDPPPASGVQISAAARAMAGVSGMAASAQLNLFMQYVGALGGSGRSFTPFSPTAAATEQVQVDAAAEARSDAAESAIAQEAETVSQAVVVETPLPPAALAPQISSYQQVAQVTTPAPAPTVNTSA